MKQLLLVGICSLLLFSSCGNTGGKVKDKEEVTAATDLPELKASAEVDFPVYNYDELAPLLQKEDGKTYIVNFWATWCKPCVKELPDFERTYAEQKGNDVELILVSLDMPSMWEKRLVPFVAKNKLQGQVVILNDPKMNDWIPKVDENWGGGIPATLIYNKSQRAFFEHGFTYEELNKELNKFIN